MFALWRLLVPLFACLWLLHQSVSGFVEVILVRGPYLQKSYTDTVSVHWRTNVPTDSQLNYGTDSKDLNESERNDKKTTDHVVKVKNLESFTKYFYNIGSQTEVLAGGRKFFFYTSPDDSDQDPIRIWVIGDSGTANLNARNVRNAYYRFTGSRYTNVWLMLGDNAYDSGRDSEYQLAVFQMYNRLLRRTTLWPTIGNHDTELDPLPPRNLPYHQIFNLPKKGEAGGVPSGTEDYYSFDYGFIHFVCLDSTTKDRSKNGSMLTWLKKDLDATGKPWIIAYWHHAPYSKGTHDSDEDTVMKQMRENALPILERYGVDVVLGGHAHQYQRSYLLFGHYRSAATFRNSMILDTGNGRINGDGPYRKSAGKFKRGTVYVVAGSSGKLDSRVIRHPAMFIALQERGSFVLDIDPNELNGQFLSASRQIDDHFSFVKQ